MANERWMKMVKKAAPDTENSKGFMWKVDAVTLLARQHRAMVQRVKKFDDPTDQYSVRAQVVRDILAALAKQGGRKKD